MRKNAYTRMIVIGLQKPNNMHCDIKRVNARSRHHEKLTSSSCFIAIKLGVGSKTKKGQ